MRSEKFINNEYLSFSFCGALVEYKIADKNAIAILFNDGSQEVIPNHRINSEWSLDIFSRNGKIKNLNVLINEDDLK